MSSSRNEREKNRFYYLAPTYATKFFWAYAADEGTRKLANWDYNQLAEFPGTAALEAREGTTAGDFVWNDLLLLVVSDKVINLLVANDVELFSTFRVAVIRREGRVQGYHGLAIQGNGGSNSPEANSAKVVPGTSIRKVRGLYPTNWDGSDLFTLDDFRRIALATERLRMLFKRENVTNCRFVPAEEFSI